ncbi:hypothetical protein ACOZ4L_01140 [Haloplanus ruber]|uniref:Uncharacterized protein n=1 Tax=Haloplanus ruber TaxID=869892 RepID=A0ABD6CZI8_9EURY|nr:hypothetical protein [Haloplanus ruber]
MPNEPPTVSDYEEMAEVDFDFSDDELDRETLNARLAEMFDN